MPAPPRREWAQVVDGGGAVGALQPHPYPGRTSAVPQPYTLRIDGPCWLRAVPNAALRQGVLLRDAPTRPDATANGATADGTAAASGASCLPIATSAASAASAAASAAFAASAAAAASAVT